MNRIWSRPVGPWILFCGKMPTYGNIGQHQRKTLRRHCRRAVRGHRRREVCPSAFVSEPGDDHAALRRVTRHRLPRRRAVAPPGCDFNRTGFRVARPQPLDWTCFTRSGLFRSLPAHPRAAFSIVPPPSDFEVRMPPATAANAAPFRKFRLLKFICIVLL